MRSTRSPILFLVWLLPSLVGCGGDGATIPIRICGTLDLTEVDVIRVLVTDLGAEELFTAVAASTARGDEISLPLDTDVPEETGPGLVTAEARSGGLVAGRYTMRVRDLMTMDRLDFPLDIECQRFSCADGQTCVSGECVTIPLVERSAPCP